MNLKHEKMMAKLCVQKTEAGIIYWRKRWHPKKPSGWTILGKKMRPVSFSKAKKRVENE